MADAKKWLLETGCPGATYENPRNNALYNQIWEDWENGVDLAEKYKGLAKRLENPFPEQLHTAQMAADPACRVYTADADGTFEIDNEPDAIYLFWVYWRRSHKTCFNVKYGKAVPRSVKEDLAKYYRDLEAERNGERPMSSDGQRRLGLISVNG